MRPDYRSKGLGELLIVGLFERAMEVGARWVTLEVRVSNSAAQGLYRGFGFAPGGIRPGYYNDNGEDALVMWSHDIGSPAQVRRREDLAASMGVRLRTEEIG